MTAVCAGLYLCVRSVYERHVFETDTYELYSDKLRTDRTLVFLSDLHNNRFGKGQSRLLAAIAGEKPDAVLIGGDMMVVKERAEIGEALFLAKKLARHWPVYYGNGNHEIRMNRDRGRYGDIYDRYVRELKEAGVCYLSNESADLGDDLRISALDLEKFCYRKFPGDRLVPGYIERRLGKSAKDRYQILLVHSPRYQADYARWGADLTLSGHYHGGTVILPRLGGLMTPQYEFFSRQCFGLLEKEGKAMIVSRGLGTHSINVRLNNPSQLVVVRLYAGSGPDGKTG